MKIITNSEQETFALAYDFASQLNGGETLCLIGDLGAGKTAFSKGLAKGLGVEKIVTSPTFVLMKNYIAKAGNINKLAHIDAYRLTSGQDLEAIGSSDYINDNNCVTIIEWADRVRNIWPDNCIEINFKSLEGDEREIEIKK
ncbi:tRNA (adenosine(37)-N6)-threonylcarbamoyltransferase complex ATPase subunit type 1 TsaE [Candidatus Falkowbacteria bacterium]|uniref:tRNA threonylcarbamoyladenosine biosynthesis protein TsaE n=1 Tax=Candidatus Buchananbacteria bacterium CG10_big_fil_rev_8_21_14_0_10_33_19 TaxID=1974525 RepID=A0A2H0W6T6_9BACT|nr:tRNA (adenosine(37)-N6)-threonylcarbamoyltransferase complex ATPase subunit type 1 TsaE [Candidatus Falkowbacteria bacterium]PIS06350.1 MAG: tRNA (adenosine(37)-N6)-threonylcarbamoyltransferase complex ATPase subunit type 1 TsaE [Candidatus Buchananbacteria bacterium CG10_big_fil_rev_8_21_14_0_10_33_19]